MSIGVAVVILTGAGVLAAAILGGVAILVRRIGPGQIATGQAPADPSANGAPTPQQRADLVRAEERLVAREEKLDVRSVELTERERQLGECESALEMLRDERIRALEAVAGMRVSQARTLLLKDLEDRLRHDRRASCARSSTRPSSRPTAGCATSSRSSCSAWPPGTLPRPPCRSCSCPATT